DVAKAIAIVGTRRATDYGKRIVEELIAVLATYDDILIVSGLAYGIDIHVHKCCLQYRIPTVGVMGSGIDVVYPPTHRTVAQEMIKQGGGLLTEYKIGTSPDAPHFPERNRIIAGLVDVVVVVEAAQSGGALITAEYANNYHREVAAFPGSVFHEFSEGCHQLIRLHKAHLITKANDLIELMNWNKKQTSSSPQPTRMPQHLSQDEQKIWLLLAEQPLHIDELSIRSHIPIHTLASILLAMELNGWIQALPGKRFKLASL
ncbi:MAG: DNA-protecting protein DprA, partial [Flammeovirgaceae bacterium]|nr:DNA-protecting protein DprA [Flammeovirgaceae bacterium]MDW8286537.1 DNA-protecting protein DprA [Flammeovirgaceae bacterium]